MNTFNTKKNKSKPRISRVKKLSMKLVNGMEDKLYEDVFLSDFVKSALKDASSVLGFKQIDVPYVEDEKLYEKYYEINKNKLNLSRCYINSKVQSVLRPDILPGIIRAYFSNRSLRSSKTSKLLYFGDIFTNHNNIEKKQDTQGGVIVLGNSDSIYDVISIIVARNFVKKLNITNTTLRIGAPGCDICRKKFAKKIKNFYKTYSGHICKKCSSAYKKGVIPLIGCDNKNCKFKSDAPVMLDSLCDGCKRHFTFVLDSLDKLDVSYSLDPFYVKNGIWSKMVFDIVDADSDVELLSGGRMDNLSKLLSGSKVPAVGFSFFLSNILKATSEDRFAKSQEQNKDVFIANIGKEAKAKSILIMDMFYKNNIRTQTLFDDVALKIKIDEVKKLNSRIVLILGQKEVYEDIIIIRDMRTGLQEVVAISEVVARVKDKLKK